MKKLLLILLCIPLIGFGQKNDNKAILSVENWISLIDNKKYKLSWEKSDDLVKNMISIENWEVIMNGARSPLGDMLERTILSNEFKSEVPGAPDGEYIIIIYESKFENKNSALETITARKNKDNLWKVVGYYIK
tara:strand:- start:63266 stop:63667 length:402 start_codon:yes stop_codon:yes gene_type:complete